MLSKCFSLAGCITVAFGLHAAEIDLTKLPAPANKQGLTFAKDIHPLFEASCIRCHGPERAKAELRLDTLESVLKGSEHGRILSAGDSRGSKIVHAVSQLDPESAMPPKPDEGRRPRGNRPGQRPGAPAASQNPGQPPKPQGPPPKPLTPEQVSLVRAWIDQGAK